MCVCVCVCENERERERERAGYFTLTVFLLSRGCLFSMHIPQFAVS